jgi:RNA polymerase sigma-70 factor (ECF subfamily)
MDADDVLQEIILVTARRLPEVPPGREGAFLFATAFRVASERRRRRESRREVGDDALLESEDPALAPDSLLDRARARALLDRVLADMPTELRAVFTLYEIEEMTMAEIADLLSLPPGTVASRLRRAREQFEREVSRLQIEHEEKGSS